MDRKNLINRSIDFILQHFDEDISVGDVADHVHFSKYYFCRVFKEETGESIYSFMKRLKIDQSAVNIKLEKDKTIGEIGLDFGYSSSNYSTIFKLRHHVSPTEFRKTANTSSASNPFQPEQPVGFRLFEDYERRIQIQEIKDMSVLYERMIGSYAELAEKWFLFMENYKTYMNSNTLLIERFYNDPTITSLNQCICDLCMTVEEDYTRGNQLVIKGGTFATYRFEGRIVDIFCTLQGIFSIWMPQSGYEMDEKYGFNIYRKIDRANESVVMDLCIPIK